MMRNQSPARVWFLIICCLSQLLQAGFSSVANTSLPEIAKQMRVGMDALQWVVGGYMLAVASLVGAAGPMADRFGRRTMLVIGNLVMVAGSVICALSPGISQLIAGRIVQGAGAAMMAPAGLSLLTSVYTGTAERAFAVMWWSVVGTVSLSSGPIIGGLIVHYLGWRYVFWLGIPLGLAAAARSGRPNAADIGLGRGIFRSHRRRQTGLDICADPARRGRRVGLRCTAGPH